MGSLTKFATLDRPTEQDIVDLWNLIKPENTSIMSVAGQNGLRGPGNFPFINLVLNPNPDAKKEMLDKEWVFESTVLQGRGLAVSSTEVKGPPLWSCKYNVLLSLALFNNVRPPDKWAPPLPKSNLIYGAPGMKLGLVGDDMLPLFARKVVNERFGAVTGRPMDLAFETIEFPELNDFVCLKIDLGNAVTSQEMHEAIGREIDWCLPYTVLVFSDWKRNNPSA